MTPALYRGRVMHRRHVAPFYRFIYRVCYLWVDIDRLDQLAASVRGFSHNRWNLMAFYERDHGDHVDAPLRPWVQRQLQHHGIDLQGGPIYLLCLPRVLGFVFNPISLFHCHDSQGRLKAVVVEVQNTFGEQHSYVLHQGNEPLDLSARHLRPKRFHVSPFLDVAGEYQFQLDRPGASTRLIIHEFKAGQPIMTASLAGTRRPLTGASVLRLVLTMPFNTLSVVIGIHWQALKLWLRGAGYRPKPAPPNEESTG